MFPRRRFLVSPRAFSCDVFPRRRFYFLNDATGDRRLRESARNFPILIGASEPRTTDNRRRTKTTYISKGFSDRISLRSFFQVELTASVRTHHYYQYRSVFKQNNRNRCGRACVGPSPTSCTVSVSPRNTNYAFVPNVVEMERKTLILYRRSYQ